MRREQCEKQAHDAGSDDQALWFYQARTPLFVSKYNTSFFALLLRIEENHIDALPLRGWTSLRRLEGCSLLVSYPTRRRLAEIKDIIADDAHFSLRELWSRGAEFVRLLCKFVDAPAVATAMIRCGQFTILITPVIFVRPEAY